MIKEQQAKNIAKTLNFRDMRPYKECPYYESVEGVDYIDNYGEKCNAGYVTYKADCGKCGGFCKGRTPTYS